MGRADSTKERYRGMSTRTLSENLPAWSWEFAPGHIQQYSPLQRVEDITPDWAWGGSTGAGVKVAVIDSGIDNNNPAVAGHVKGYVYFWEDNYGQIHSSQEPHSDAFGHATACADIIRRLAPDCELYSVKVLDATLSGKGPAFLAGLRWAIEHGMQVINMSLGSTNKEYSGIFYELTDEAYFKDIVLVAAANNMPVISYPSLYASVISVASHSGQDLYEFYYNPEPPVEFGAPGVNLTVAWLGGQQRTVTGNSFAAPHISGLVAKILGKYPGLTPFLVKAILHATARNASRQSKSI
jgi:subtilisin